MNSRPLVSFFIGLAVGISPLFSQLHAETSPDPAYVPLAPPVQTPNAVALTPAQQLGKDIFFDYTLSNPVGYSCASCHNPYEGFTGSSMAVNLTAGPVPGVVAGRVGRRKPQTIPYTAYSPYGPSYNAGLGVYLGGTFWDGRTPDLAGQARMPFLDANEMANTSSGLYPPHAGGYAPLVAQKVQSRSYTTLFKSVFGPHVFELSSQAQIYQLITQAIAAYEASSEINSFTSKYDASPNGYPVRHVYTLTADEEAGRQLFFGQAQCFQCHSSATLTPVLNVSGGRDTFTMYCYANVGVPKNPDNPYYYQASPASDPNGANPLGTNYVDYGLGANPNTAPDGTVFYKTTPGDIAAFRGLFKAPTLRNADRRADPTFVKAYMHNGVFKNLQQVVHFYNKRNIAADTNGNEQAFDLGVGPPSGFTPLFAPPEVLDNVQNSQGVSPANAGTDVSNNGQVGNLGLTEQQEAQIVSFLQTLTDGYTVNLTPGPAWLSQALLTNANFAPGARTGAAGSGSAIFYYKGSDGNLWKVASAGKVWAQTVLTTSQDVTDWVASHAAYSLVYYQNSTNDLCAVHTSGGSEMNITHSLVTRGVSNVAGDIVVDTVSNRIFYRGTDAKLWSVTYSGNTWSQTLLGTVANVVGNLSVDSTHHFVYYTDGNSQLWQLHSAGATWPQTQVSTVANVGGAVQADPAGPIYYRSSADSTPWALTPNGSVWKQASLGVTGAMGSSIFLYASDTPMFIDAGGQCEYLSPASGLWQNILLGDGGSNLASGLSQVPGLNFIFAGRADGNIVLFSY